MTPLMEFKSEQDMAATKDVLLRMGERSPEIDGAYTSALGILGGLGDMRRRMNNCTGPYIVVWEDDEPLGPDDLATYINNMPLTQRTRWLKQAEI